MSKESAKAFVKKMAEDRAFSEAMEKLGSVQERTAFAKAEGFDFSREEMTEAAMELNAADVSGGRCCSIRCENEPCGNDRASTSYCRLQAG